MTSMTLMSPFLQSHFSRAYLYMQYKTAPQSHQFKCYETFRLINSRDGAPVVVSGSLFCLCFFDKYRFIFKVVLHLSVSVEYVWTVLHWTFFLMMRKHEKQRLWFQDGIGRFSVKRRTHFYITCCKLMKFANLLLSLNDFIKQKIRKNKWRKNPLLESKPGRTWKMTSPDPPKHQPASAAS